MESAWDDLAWQAVGSGIPYPVHECGGQPSRLVVAAEGVDAEPVLIGDVVPGTVDIVLFDLINYVDSVGLEGIVEVEAYWAG